MPTQPFVVIIISKPAKCTTTETQDLLMHTKCCTLTHIGHSHVPQYGRDSAIARSIAQGSVDAGSPILNALAHDLDKLQDIAVDQRDLAVYISEVAPTCGNAYVTAGACGLRHLL